MLIPEGSKLEIYDGMDESNPLIEKIIANEDIKIEGDGAGYTILLRHKGYDTNNIFLAEKIKKTGDDTYEINGYFKDALLVLQSKNCNPAMFESYMDY